MMSCWKAVATASRVSRLFDSGKPWQEGLRHLACRHGPREQKALRRLAAVGAQIRRLLLGLDALGTTLKPSVCAISMIVRTIAASLASSLTSRTNERSIL